MKTITGTIITAVIVLFATATIAMAEQTDSTDTDIVVADNIIEAVNNIDIISLNVLLAEGATVDSVDEAGNTPLMLAAKIGNPRMVKIILAHNPKVNARNEAGLTALMIASENGILPIIKELKEYGADAGMKNRAGLNSLEIAQRNGHGSVVQFYRGSKEISFSR